MIRTVVDKPRVQDGDPNLTSVTRDFDGADRVAKVVYGFSGGGWPVSYTRGPSGELVGASQLSGTNTWAYDPGRQLTATTNPTNTYSFDSARNPTALNTTAQVFDPSGELCWTGPTTGVCGNTPAGSTTYHYDTNGQRISAGATSFSYDGTGQMRSATTPSGTSSYTYAPDGLRTSKTVGGTTTVFAWDDTTPVPELLQDGDDYYLYGPDGLPVERIGADPTRWLMCDATGSVTLTTDADASIASVQGYDPWGNPTTTTGTPVSLGWQHQYQDTETGYYNLWRRYYDPTTAQFTTIDPLVAATRSAYGYAANDPINGSDPSGLFHIPGTSYCVDIGDSNCHSNADGESLNWEDTKTGLGLTAGIVSVGTGIGAIGIGGVALGVTSLVTGLGAATLDLGPCMDNGPRSAACLGLGLGGAGAVLGAAPLGITLGVVTEESALGTLLTGLGAGGLSMGLAGLFLDTTVAVFGDPTLGGARCDEP